MSLPARALALALPLLALLAAPSASAVRLKDLGYFEGVRPNQLIGYGLVVGLDGTGDSDRSTFTPQSLESLLSRLGIRVDAAQLTLRNVAAVMVTTSLPAFAKPGASLDVTVSSIGDARSLAGGTLLMTPLQGGDGQVYAVAQGALKVGTEASSAGYRSGGGKRKLNVGRVPEGALVEREVKVTLGAGGAVRFLVGRPDFQTASNVAEVVNGLTATLAAAGGAPVAAGPDAEKAARVVDSGTVAITVPEAYEEDIAAFIARLELLEVRPDTAARVVVNGRTGAVVLGGNVRLSKAAIAYEGLTVEITSSPAPDAPPAAGAPAAPGAPGAAAAAPPVSRDILPSGLQIVDEATTLAELVAGLNALGLTAQELIDILEALAAAGALHAELEVL